MKEIGRFFRVAGLVLAIFQIAIFAQTAGSIAGTVTDANGAVVPNVTVVVKSESGQEFTGVTNDNGGFRFPIIGAGTYTVTATAANFKRSLTENV
jgi:hypothetical protein